MVRNMQNANCHCRIFSAVCLKVFEKYNSLVSQLVLSKNQEKGICQRSWLRFSINKVLFLKKLRNIIYDQSANKELFCFYSFGRWDGGEDNYDDNDNESELLLITRLYTVVESS